MVSAVLRVPRIASYMVTGALAVVGAAATLNALIKARKDRNAAAAYAVSLAPFPNFSVSIDLNDVLKSGGFLAAGEILFGLIAFFSYTCLIFPGLLRKTEFSKKTQTVALVSWVFTLVWTLATAISTTIIGRGHQAKTNAFVSGVALPPDTVAALQKATGIDPRYWIHGYTKFLVIAPWPLIFFAIISTVLTFMSYSRTDFAAGHVEYPDVDASSTGRTSESISDEKKSSPV